MDIETKKQEILGTRMTELGLGTDVGKVFSFDIFKNPIAPAEILTLGQFITMNRYVVKKTELLVCNNKGQKKLNQLSTSGKVVIQFLVNSGFTEKDFKILGLKKRNRGPKEERFVITAETDKEVLKKLPYTQVCKLQLNAKSTQWINKILELCAVPDEDGNVHSLKNLLLLSKEGIMSTFYNPELPVDAFIRIASSLRRARANLVKLDFTEAHGPFMTIPDKWFSKKATVCSNETVLQRVKDGQLELGFTAGKLAHLPGVSESAMAG